ncbi:MAG: C39 family peptidase [Eubacteriales bacterium]|nr:C39 family peptidase [Eubacteriales bacterium]
MKKCKFTAGAAALGLLAVSACSGFMCSAEEFQEEMVVIEDTESMGAQPQEVVENMESQGAPGDMEPQDVPEDVPAQNGPPENMMPQPAPEEMNETYENEWHEFPEGEMESTDSYDETYENEGKGSIHRISGEGKIIDNFDIPGKEEALRDFNLNDEIPSSMFLDVPEIMQKPVLPTGCEAVSLTMALQYEGFDVDEIAIADEFLIYNNESDNMAVGYVGDPFSEEGAGCFPPALAATACSFFEDQDADYMAYNITGSSLDDLLSYVAAGTPVIVWTTMYMAEPEFTREDAEYDGHVYYWYRQEHCVVLSGYDLTSGTLQINDPLEGIVTRDKEEFSRIYTKTGENAVVLRSLSEEDAMAQDNVTSSVSSRTANTEAGIG